MFLEVTVNVVEPAWYPTVLCQGSIVIEPAVGAFLIRVAVAVTVFPPVSVPEIVNVEVKSVVPVLLAVVTHK